MKPIKWIAVFVVLAAFIQVKTAQAKVLLTGEVSAKHSETFYAPRVTGWQIQIEWMMPEGQIAKPGELVVLFERASVDSEIELKNSDLLKKTDQLALAKSEGEEAVLTAEFEHKKALLELEKSRIDAGVSKQFVSLFDFEKAAIEFQKQQLAVEKAQRQLLTRQEEMASEIKKIETQIQKTQFELTALEKKSRLTALKTVTGGPVIYASHPWNGKKLNSGSSVQATWKVAEVASGKDMRVTAWLNEVDKGAVAKNDEVRLTFDARNGQSYAGVVTNIVPQAEEREAWGTAAYFELEIDILDAVEVSLVPGMSVLVEVL